jgi:parvulin-like peptidyl-prolyl isomerase
LTRRPTKPSGKRRPWADLDPDQRNTLLLYAAIGSVVLFALALIGAAYYNDRIAPRGDPVLQVGDRKFDYSALERRAIFEVRQGTFSLTSTIAQAVVQTLQNMELEELTRQTARDLGIGVTEQEIDEHIRTRLGLSPDVDRNTFASFYRAAVLRSGLKTSEYRDLMAAEVAQNKLNIYFSEAVLNELEHVDVRLILVGSQSQALTAKERLEAGEEFALVAATLSGHSSRDVGGDIGWVPSASLGPTLEEVVLKMQPGQTSDIIEVEGGFYILRVLGREVRVVDEQGRYEIAAHRVNDALIETRDRVGTRANLTEHQVERVARAILDDRSLARG